MTCPFLGECRKPHPRCLVPDMGAESQPSKHNLCLLKVGSLRLSPDRSNGVADESWYEGVKVSSIECLDVKALMLANQ